MDFRKATEKDFPVLLDMCRFFTTSPFTFDKELSKISPSVYPAFADEILKSSASFTIVSEDNGITGFITVCVNQAISKHAGKTIGNILLLVVDERHRGRGLGRQLVQKGLGYLFALGALVVTVGTDLYNYPAIRVYESQGFRFKTAWHIFRHFNEGPYASHILENIDVYTESGLERFIDQMDRPISLLKETGINRENLRAYLKKNFLKSIHSGGTTTLQYFNRGTPAAMLHITRDEIAKKTLKTDKPIYKIADLIVLDIYKNKGIERKLLKDALSRLLDYSLMEIWIDAENQSLIHAAEDSGFRLSYTGVSYHLVRV